MSTINQTVADWAEKVLDIWGERMSVLGISNAESHANSFVHTVITAAGGDPAKVNFMFDYILKFTDMGVGRGVNFATRSQTNTKRKQKQWLTKTFLLEVKKLSNILAKEYAHSGVLYIKESIEAKNQ
jgi:hypothetical protein